MSIETSWVRNLPEVGEPVKDMARRIATVEADADKAVAEAMRWRREIRRQLRAEVKRLESTVQSLWKPGEIAEAKTLPRLGWND